MQTQQLDNEDGTHTLNFRHNFWTIHDGGLCDGYAGFQNFETVEACQAYADTALWPNDPTLGNFQGAFNNPGLPAGCIQETQGDVQTYFKLASNGPGSDDWRALCTSGPCSLD